MPIVPGTRLGPYEILAPLGAGGMGEVYRARDTRLAREVAIKVLPAALRRRSRPAQRSRRRRARPRRSNHPNIVTIYDIGEPTAPLHRDGAGRGKDPAGAPRGRRLSPIKRLLARRAGRRRTGQGPRRRDRAPGLEAREPDGHAGRLRQDPRLRPGQADRDAERGSVRAADGHPARPSPGRCMGTVGYMSPEQASGQPVDFRSDQFSFGAILYEMATGRRAFERSTTGADAHGDHPRGARAARPAAPQDSRPSCAGSSSAASPRIPRSATPRPGTSRATSRACAIT